MVVIRPGITKESQLCNFQQQSQTPLVVIISVIL